jgi:hypothetical protein
LLSFLRDADLAAAMSEMRHWLDRNRISPKSFTFSAADRVLVFRLEFENGTEAAAFAGAVGVGYPAARAA